MKAIVRQDVKLIGGKYKLITRVCFMKEDLMELSKYVENFLSENICPSWGYDYEGMKCRVFSEKVLDTVDDLVIVANSEKENAEEMMEKLFESVGWKKKAERFISEFFPRIITIIR